MTTTPGEKFREAMRQEKPLQIVGAINAYVALMAKRQGFRCLYLSGAGVANSSYGLPDLAITSLENVLEDASRILAAVDLPLMVDIDTGWGNELNIARAIKLMGKAGVAAIHIEDQAFEKRCGHRPGKKIVPTEEMTARVKAAHRAKVDPSFVIVARTDAYHSEGLDGVIKRAIAYKNAGADVIFPEAFESLEQYKKLKQAVDMPVLANITEFGKTPLYTLKELKKAGVDIALYPLTINRLMNKAAELGLETLRKEGSQKKLIDKMQTRDQLYEVLDYHSFEKQIDEGGKKR